ncbi:MAG: Nif3-like dinuclear metal center hexameric protein [Campylobacterota bacterium]
MKLAQIYEQLDRISPFELQESWDNSGLLVGSGDMEVENVVLTLDVTKQLSQEHPPNTLFIAHHPLIFGKLKALDFSCYPANVIQSLIQKNQSMIAMHTNVDKTHLNRYVFEKVLGFEVASEDDFMLRAKVTMKKEVLYRRLSQKLQLKNFRVVNEKEHIDTIALTTGSGSSMMDMCGCDCFLTGDMKYHEAIKAQQQDLMVVDINHFESELFFADALFDELKKIDISVIISNSKNPFTNVTM